MLAPWSGTARGQSTYYWDSNGATAGFGSTTGTWGSSAFWSTSSSGTAATANTTITSLDTVNFGTTLDYSNAAVGIAAGGVTVGGIVMGSGQTTALTLGTAGNAITIHGGITKNAGAAALTVSSPIILGAAQTWTNSATSTLTVGNTIANGGFTLTVDTTGQTSFNSGTSVLSGSGGLTKNGDGLLVLGGAAPNNTHTYTGTTTINGGGILVGSTGFGTGTGNITINGGWIEQYFQNTLTRGLGSGTGQLQITGGTSGFSGQGATSSTFTISGVTNLVWGSTFFNPSVLLLGSSAANANGKGSLSNGIDLNGADRTITSTQVTDGAANSGFTISGVISSSTGTAGFTKTGVGNLILGSTANTYGGATTISGGWLTVRGSGGLGNGSATNTLIFNGGTLRATAAITSPATRGVTMTATGVIDTNGQAISIAGNISGAGGLTKNGLGTLTLSGTNTYAGVTAVNNGTLAITKEAALYNGDPANWTAGNVNVKSGASLALNVDSAGTAGFTASNLATLFGNISVAASTTAGLQARTSLSLDTATATGGTFTTTSPITDSSGAFGGIIGFTKTGTGTLVLDQANSYTGPTTVGGGTLRLGSGGVAGSLNTTNVIAVASGATFAINRSNTATQGGDFSATIFGAGSLANEGSGTLVLNSPTYHTGTTKATSGTITLSNALAIQQSALDTTGAGTFSLTGVTAPTFGGLNGATGDLASVIANGYGGVASLTLNPQSGSTFTYGGVIADGASGMTLTKTGAGTQALTGASTYTGVTTLRNGVLNFSGNGTIATTSGITLAGGTITLTNTNTAESTLDRIGDTTPITSTAGGTITYTNTAGANLNYAESLGSVALQAGQLNVVLTTNQNNATSNSQTLSLAGLTRGGASNTSAVAFSAASTSPQASTGDNMIRVNGVATSTPSGQIIGPWATTGTAAANQTDYAAYASNGTDAFVTPAGATLTNPGESGWTSGTTAYQFAAAATLTATRSAAALRYTGAAASLSLGTSTFNLETTGVLNGGSGLLTIQNGTGGTGGLTTPAGGGSLFLATGNNSITVSVPINDNSGVVTVVKPVSGGTLTLSATTSTYSGGTIINGGSVQITADTNLGGSSGGITLAGGRLHIPSANVTSARTVMVAAAGGQLFVSKNNNFTTSGNLTGSGPLTLVDGGGAGTLSTYNFNSTANDFTGTLVVNNAITTLNSLADSSNNIMFSGASGGTFNWGAGAIVPLVLDGRGIVISQTASGQTFNLNNNNTTASNTITVNKDLLVNGTGTATLSLGGVNTGTNLFAGRITDGVGGAVGVTKTGGGNWALSGANAYSGTTVITGSSTTGDNRLIFQGIQALSPNTRIELRDVSSSQGTIRVLDDNGGTSNGTVNRATVSVTFRSSQSSAAGTTNIFVGNNNAANGGNSSGTATGNTIALGDYISSPQNFGAAGETVNITGANGYRLQLAGLAFPNLSTKSAATTFTITLNPTTAPVTVAGDATAFASTNANSAPILALGGTAAGNRIDGNVLDPTNVGTSNALRITKSNTNDWALNGSGNTFSGAILFSTTTTSGGRLSYASASGTNPITFNQTTSFGTTLSYTGASPLTMSGLISATALTTGSVILEANGTSPTAAINYSNTGSFSTTSTSTGTRFITFGGSNTGDNTFAGGINNNTGSGGATQVSKTGAGKWVLTGTSNFSGGLFVNQGTISVASIPNGGVSGPLGANPRINLGRDNTDGTLVYTGPGDTTNRELRIGGPSSAAGVGGSAILNDGTGPLAFTVAAFNISQTGIIDTRTLTLGGGYTGGINDIQGVIQDNTASTGLVNLAKTGNGSWRLSGFNTYSGATTVSGGTLEIASTGSINATSGVSVAPGAMLVYNSATALTAPTTLGGTGTGAGQRAVLGGTGTISLALALDNTGDVLSPGNSPGIMPFATTQTWSSFGYDWELNDWAASVAGTNIDQIQITGGLDLTGTTAGSYVVDVLSLTAGNVAGNVPNFMDAPNSWTILTTTDGITGFDASRWTIDSSGFTSAPTATGTWSVGLSNDSQDLVLLYNAVPEPSTLALAALGLAALGWRLRRRGVTRGSPA